jgi:integrase
MGADRRSPHCHATMCLMANMNTAFIANQLGHSVQMLLSTYAKWINCASDWAELNKLRMYKLARLWPIAPKASG